jgi:putative DNA primase/helicase
MTATIPAVQVQNIPTELGERRQWVVWRYEERDGKRTKVPYVPGTHRRASHSDLMTWRNFSRALQAYENYDGIGFMFSSADPYVGIDLDHCRDPESGEIAEWAQEIVDRVGDEAYVEVSPSGTGVHIITRGTVRGGGMRKKVEPEGEIELYSQQRFFTMTGEVL